MTASKRVKDRGATLALAGWHLYVDNWMWTVLEVATSGEVLVFRDEPAYDRPGVAHHRWLTVGEVDAAIAADLERRFQW
jgi:hypothetical protein